MKKKDQKLNNFYCSTRTENKASTLKYHVRPTTATYYYIFILYLININD